MNNNEYRVEYDGLHLICIKGWCFGHKMDQCALSKVSENQGKHVNTQQHRDEEEEEEANFDP